MTELIPGYQNKKEIGELFSEYTDMLVQNDPEMAAYLKLQNYDLELQHLEEKYGLPEGRLYLLIAEGQTAGCIGLRKIDETRCEMKRLYIRPQFRGKGLSKMLVERVITDAERIGYHYMLLDTLPFLKEAIALYEKYGFYRIDAYNDSPVKNSIFMRLDLDRTIDSDIVCVL